MIGRRRDLTEWAWLPEDTPTFGDYGRQPDMSWYAITPTNLMANINSHQVIEHEDQTITVSPSILVSDYLTGEQDRTWHGFLEHGVWRAV